MNKSRLLQIALLMSLLIHLGAGLGTLFIPSAKKSDSTPQVIDVQYVDRATQKNKQSFVTETEQAEPRKTKPDEPARFLSKFTKRTSREQVAQKTGPTKNGAPKLTQQRKQKLDLAPKFKPVVTADQGMTLKTGRKKTTMDIQSPAAPSQPSFESTISEYIPEVEEGFFTALNTDQFTYYAFFSRVSEKVRFKWVRNLRNYIDQLPHVEVNSLAQRPRKTRIEVILDPSGNYLDVIVHESSGRKAIDWAAVSAFQEASPLNHPPQELVGKDGLIRLEYAFFLQWQSSGLAGR